MHGKATLEHPVHPEWAGGREGGWLNMVDHNSEWAMQYGRRKAQRCV